MNLYKVEYREWNTYFSDMHRREMLSVGKNEREAIDRVKEVVAKDASSFEAEKISTVFGHKVLLNDNMLQEFGTDKIDILTIASDINRQKIFDTVIEEACRQWCDTMEDAPERKSGEGFADFFYDIFREKEQQYLEEYKDTQKQISDEFILRLEENYGEMTNPECGKYSHADLYMFFKDVKSRIFEVDEENIRVLMQFKNPLKVILEMQENEIFDNKIEAAIHCINMSDVLTLPYELDCKKIMAETKFRHKAIGDIANIVPTPKFSTTMQWLDFFRNLNEEYDETTDPYHSLVDALYEISGEQGGDVLQKLYDMGSEHCILEKELTEAAKYLADGGDIAKVSKLAECGYFDAAYEENDILPDEFLARQNGINMI